MGIHESTSVSYLLLCYNQQEFVREAVRSALQQDIANLEIIISDDHSLDDTYEILQEECNGYVGGHRLILRRTTSNLGVVAHLNELVNLARGKLLIVGAGDDIAMPDKATKLFRLWRDTGALVIGCNPLIIDKIGTEIGKFYSSSVPTNFSCSAIISRRNAGIFLTAFDRILFDKFGPLGLSLLAEDQALPFRAAMIDPGAIKIIDEPLVKYRSHTGSLVNVVKFGSGRPPLDILALKLFSYSVMYRGWLEELRKFSAQEGGQKFVLELALLKRRLWFIEHVRYLVRESNLSNRFKYLRSIRNNESTRWFGYILMLLFSISPRIVAELVARGNVSWGRKRRGERGV